MSRLGQHDVGHEGVITGCDGFSLRSSIANSREVARPPHQSTYYTMHISSPTFFDKLLNAALV